MAKKITITGNNHLSSFADDWGGVNETDSPVTKYGTTVPAGAEWGMNRGEIERFIKGRFGALRTTVVDNYIHILCFATEADATAYMQDPSAHASLLMQNLTTQIAMTTGATYSARLFIHSDNATSKAIISISKDFKVKMRFCGTVTDNGVTENAGLMGTLTFQRSINNGVSWTTVGTQYINSRDVDATSLWDEIDIGQYFSTSNPQQIRVRASYTVYDDNGDVVSSAQSAWVTWSNVTYTQLTVQNMLSFNRPIMADDGVFPMSFAVGGAVDKVLHVQISGSLGTYTFTSSTIPASTEYPTTSPLSWSEAEKQNIGILTHGVHTVTAWVTCEDGDGNELSSDVVVNRFMVVNTETTGADLTAPFLMLQQVQQNVVNFVRVVLASYSVWIPDATNPTLPSSEQMAVSIRLTDYCENDTDYTTEYMRSEVNVSSNTVYDIDTAVEVEGSAAEYTAYLRMFRYDSNDDPVNFMFESLHQRSVTITVDNSEDYSPVAGANFVLNPKNRNNSESNPFTIINQQTGAVVPSTWEGFNGNIDAWVTDANGQKVLRVLAGEYLIIEYEPFIQLKNDGSAEVTIDFDFAVRNITQEDEPIIDVCQIVAGELLGLRMLPLEGFIKCVGYQSNDNQNFGWQEGVRTHVSIVIDPEVITKASDELTWQQTLNGATSHPLSLAKVYVNGNPYREMIYSPLGTAPAAGTWITGNGHGGIKIGNPHADIDIYGIRCYRQALSAEQVRQNRTASLPTADEKLAMKTRNAITTSGRIDYEKTKAAGYRCLTLVGQDQYKLNQSKDPGYPCYWRIDHDNPALSGTIGKAAYLASVAGTLGDAKCLMVTPQGSTANTYWDNNEQTKVDGITFRIIIPFSKVHSDFGWSAAKSTGANCDYPMYLDGERIEGTSYASLTDEQKAQVTIEVPDGWFDGNGWSENTGEMGMYHGQFYTSYIGGAKCTKLVNKINYASPMQSHKMGATQLYHDVMQAVTGGNSMTQAGARFSVYEESFMFFTEHPQDNGKVEFRGMCTFGNGKFDKAVFGIKAKAGTFAFEGLNNNLPLCDFRVPADENVTYDPDDEAWGYNGTKSFEYGLGATQKIGGKKYPTTVNDTVFRRYVNFFYLHTTSLRYYNGTKDAFLLAWENMRIEAQTDNDVATQMAEMQKHQYWCTQGYYAFQLLRYDFINDGWMDAGIWDDESDTFYTAGVRNLSTDSVTVAAYNAWRDGADYGDYSKLNTIFRQAIAQHGKDNIGLVAHLQSHLTHYNLVNFFLAGTDNCSKNTYYQYDPDSGLIWLDQDDLDSILKTDNNGRQTKVYFLDRIHDLEDYTNGYKTQTDYEGGASSLFNFIEVAYEEAGSELRANMRSILTAMSGLVGASDGYDISVYGCLEKYFFSIQNYFPEVAYAEQARLRYEWPKSFGYISYGNQARGVDPITQQVGSQLESERQYMKRRLALVASYACWGDFSSGVNSGVVGLDDSGAALSMSPGSGYIGGEYTFEVVPHQWLYPTGAKDRVAVDPHVRVAPGETYSFTVSTAGEISGDSSVGLAALNYYRKIGNIGNMVCHNDTLTVIGNRLTEFKAEPSNGSTAFAPGTINLSTPNLQQLSLNGCSTIGGSKDFSLLTRLESMDLRGTTITSVLIPTSSMLATLQLPATIVSLTLRNLPALETMTMEGCANLETFIVTNCPYVDTKVITVAAYSAQQTTRKLTTLTLTNVRWNDLAVGVLSWIADTTNVTLTGYISIYEPNPTQNAVTFAIKDKINKKWGNVDDATSEEYQGLFLSYAKRQVASASVMGNFYNDGGTQYPFGIVPNSTYVNGFTKIRWSLSGLEYSQATIDPITGVLTVQSLSGFSDTATVTAMITTYYDGSYSTIIATKEISLYNRKAALGDYVYADGTYSSPDTYDGEKQVIGICCYLAPEDSEGNIVAELFNPNDKQKRLMVALQNVTATGSQSSGGLTFTSWQWGSYCNTSESAANYAARCIHDLVPQSGNDLYNKLKVPEANLTTSTFYDIPTIVNITSAGANGTNINDTTMRDTVSTLGVQNHGFLPYPPGVGNGDGVIGGNVAGSTYADSAAQLEARTLDSSLAALAGDGYSAGDIVNSGYAKTLKIIEHRNKILNNGVVMIPADPDNGVLEDRLGPLDTPHAGNGQTELESLASLMGTLRSYMSSHYSETNLDKWMQLYYPAASAAYAYQPTMTMGQTLADKFKAHNWFLPPLGILARLCWYYRQGTSSDLNIFKKAIADNLFTNFSSSYYWSSTEYYRVNACIVYFPGFYSNGNYKGDSTVVRAVAAF